MYTQTQKGLSILLLTSMLLQSCGGNLRLGHQGPAMREQNEEQPAAAALENAPLGNSSKEENASRHTQPTRSPHLQPGANTPPPYTAPSAWKARHQRALKARRLPPATARAGLLGGAESEDEDAREKKQSGSPPHEGQRGTSEQKASTPPTRGTTSKRATRTSYSLSPSPRASHSSPASSSHERASPLAANSDKAKAIAHFKGEDAAGIDLRLYQHWYDPSTLEYLASTLGAAQAHALKIVLHDCNPLDPQTSFVEQVKQLKLLRNSTGKKTVLFISQEPGAGAHHFLFWILHEHNLILFNPVGKSMHADLAAGLSAVKEQGLAREIYVSSTQIQRDPTGLVSCGPICAELLLHYGAMDQAAFAQAMRSLWRASKAPQGRNSPYDKEVEVSHFLPPSLYRLLEMRGNYPKRVAILRESHLRRLEHAASSLRQERLEQVCFNLLMREEGGFLALEQSEAYSQLLGASPPRPSAPLGGPDSDEEAKALPAPTTTPTRPAPLHALPPQHALLKHASAPGAVFSPLRSSLRMASKAQQLVQSIEKYRNTLRAYSGPWADPDTGQKLLAVLEELITHEQLTTANEPQAQPWLEALNSDPAIRWSPEQHKELATLLEQVYARALRPLAQAYQHSAAPDCIQPLITQLAQMAALRQARAQREADHSFFTDAATLYQHVLTLCHKERAHLVDVTYQNCTEDAYQHLLQIKAALLGRPGDTLEKAALIEEIEKDKRVLHDLRERVRLRVEALSDKALDEPHAYVEGSQTLFQDIAQGIRDFLGSRYEDYEKELGAAPCRYAVIGLGSMALSQMTPYSDLEFAIVLEEQATPQAYDYLCRLSHLVHLSVINLGETVMRRSEYGLDFEALGKRGLNFDLGGKTPLGRKDRPYTLIQPVEGLMHYLRNEDHQSERLDKGLPMILESTCYVYGHQPLHQAYEEQKTAWLLEPSVCRARARQALVEGTRELDDTQPGRHRPGNLTDFVPKLEEDDMGRRYNVKQELYRLPDRLLHQLALYHGYAASSGWNAIKQLLDGGILNEEAAQHLRYAMSFATMVRLRTYLYYQRQQEDLLVLGSRPSDALSQAPNTPFTLPTAALREEGTLLQYYYTALPLHERLDTFFKKKEEGRLQGRLQEVGFFQEASFYQADTMVKGAIHERLGNYARALQCYKEAYALYETQQHGEQLAQCLLQEGRVQAALGLFEESLACYERALTIYQDLYPGKDHPHKADCLDCVGMAYQALDNKPSALARFQEGLAMRQRWYGAQPHAALARSLHHVGEAHGALGEKEPGLLHLEQASKMYRALYPKQPHPALARAMLSVGAAHEAAGDRMQGKECKEEALTMLEALYPEQDHPWLSEALDAVGSAYQSVKDIEDLHRALGYKEAALAMRERLYGAQAHPLLAYSLSAVGESYGLLGGLRKGLQYQKKGLAMLAGLDREQVMHGFLVPMHLALGRTYLELSEAREGLSHFEEAQRLYEVRHADQPSEALAQVYEGLAKASEALGNRRQSVAHNEIASRIRRSLLERTLETCWSGTDELCRLLCTELDEATKKKLQYFIGGYFTWFDEESVSTLLRESGRDLREYSLLVYTLASSPTAYSNLRTCVEGLCAKIVACSPPFDPTLFISVLANTLQLADGACFRGDAADLLNTVVRALLSKLNSPVPDPAIAVEPRLTCSFIKAFHHALTLLHQINAYHMQASYQAYREFLLEKLEDIHKKLKDRHTLRNAMQVSYDIIYCKLLIEQNLRQMGRVDFQSTRLASLRLYPGFRERVDIDALLDCFPIGLVDPNLSKSENFHRFFNAEPTGSIEECYHLLTWIMSASFSILSEEGLGSYTKCQEALKFLKEEERMPPGEGLTMLHYGVVSQLRMLALHSSDGRIRRGSVEDLMEISENSRWTSNPEVLDKLLESLKAVATQSTREHSDEALRVLARNKLKELVERLPRNSPLAEKWPGGQALDDMLDLLKHQYQQDVATTYQRQSAEENVFGKVKARLSTLLLSS